MLLEEGLARLAYVYDPPYMHFNEYMKAQNRAKSAEKGIWSLDGYVKENGFETQPSENGNKEEQEEDTPYSGELKYELGVFRLFFKVPFLK